MIFTEKIFAIMKEKDITAYEICKNLNISQTTFTSWKRGSKPSIDKATEIMRYLQVSADEILELKKDPPDFTKEEIELVQAYRVAAPAMQEAVRKLLELDDKSKSSDCQIGKKIG